MSIVFCWWVVFIYYHQSVCYHIKAHTHNLCLRISSLEITFSFCQVVDQCELGQTTNVMSWIFVIYHRSITVTRNFVLWCIHERGVTGTMLSILSLKYSWWLWHMVILLFLNLCWGSNCFSLIFCFSGFWLVTSCFYPMISGVNITLEQFNWEIFIR